MTDKIDILIAEDSRLQAKMLKKKLEEAGYAVRWAENGKIALEMTRAQRPALIISDIEMPEMTGYEALAKAKLQPSRISMGLEVDKGIAREGCSVLASGSCIGVVTSGTHSPTLGRPVAIALVYRDADTEDLAVDVRGKPRPARVTALPFYVRDASGT